MIKKQAHAVIYYSALAISTFRDTFRDFYNFFKPDEKQDDPILEDLFSAVSWQEYLCTNLLNLSRDRLGLEDKSVPTYKDLLKELKVERLSESILREAAKTLIKDLNLSDGELSDYRYITD